MWLFFLDRANCGSSILLQSRLLSMATEGTYGKAQLFPSHICVRISHQGAFQRPCSVMEYSLHVFFRCCLIQDSYSGGHLFATNAFTVTTAISRTCVPGGNSQQGWDCAVHVLRDYQQGDDTEKRSRAQPKYEAQLMLSTKFALLPKPIRQIPFCIYVVAFKIFALCLCHTCASTSLKFYLT